MNNYWHWFFRGGARSKGLLKFLDRWLLFHFLIGAFFSYLLPLDLQTAANSVLLPLASILVGLSFAWGGNAVALLQTEEMNELVSYHPSGLENYVYTYQSAILVILITLVAWGTAGLGVFDRTWPTCKNPVAYFLSACGLFSLASMTMRECWQVVLSAQWMLLLRREIRSQKSKMSQ